MGLLGDFTAYIDGLKRRGMNTAKDLASDPMGLLGRNVSALSESLPAAPGEPQNEMLARPGMQDWATGVAMNAPTMGLLGHTVYHGSPHKFDKFDASKIGTGEGAQAYGHGIYVAESPDVARSYVQSVVANSDELAKRGASHGLPDDVASNLVAAKQSGKNFDSMLDAAKKAADNPLLPQSQKMAAQRLVDHEMQAYNAWSDWSKPGNLYKVDLPDEWLPKMLDWDKPLSEQPEGVKAALRKSPFAPDESVWPHYTGRQLYEGEMNARGPYKADGWPTAAAATDVSGLLNKQGIPGIRYKDQVSRGKEGGTYNYVVFPGMEGLLKILERE